MPIFSLLGHDITRHKRRSKGGLFTLDRQVAGKMVTYPYLCVGPRNMNRGLIEYLSCEPTGEHFKYRIYECFRKPLGIAHKALLPGWKNDDPTSGEAKTEWDITEVENIFSDFEERRNNRPKEFKPLAPRRNHWQPKNIVKRRVLRFIPAL